jgi:DNA-binding transcriptional regulator YiaG
VPTQKEIKAARKAVDMTCAQAAALVGVKPLTWARWEGQTSRKTVMPAGLWELFVLKTKQKG